MEKSLGEGSRRGEEVGEKGGEEKAGEDEAESGEQRAVHELMIKV